jgi:hypothetical protein
MYIEYMRIYIPSLYIKKAVATVLERQQLFENIYNSAILNSRLLRYVFIKANLADTWRDWVLKKTLCKLDGNSAYCCHITISIPRMCILFVT